MNFGVKRFEDSESIQLKATLKEMKTKIFKLESENKSLYECLSKTDLSTESSFFLKFNEFSNFMKENKEV